MANNNTHPLTLADTELRDLAERAYAAVPDSTWDEAFGVLVDLDVPVHGPTAITVWAQSA